MFEAFWKEENKNNFVDKIAVQTKKEEEEETTVWNASQNDMSTRTFIIIYNKWMKGKQMKP